MLSSIIVVSIITNHFDEMSAYLWSGCQGTGTSSCIWKVHIFLCTLKQLPKHRRRLQGLGRNASVPLFFWGRIWVKVQQKIFSNGHYLKLQKGQMVPDLFSGFKDITVFLKLLSSHSSATEPHVVPASYRPDIKVQEGKKWGSAKYAWFLSLLGPTLLDSQLDDTGWHFKRCWFHISCAYIYIYIHIYKTLASRKNEMWLLKALPSSPLLLEEVVPGSLPQVRSGNKMEVG